MSIFHKNYIRITKDNTKDKMQIALTKIKMANKIELIVPEMK